MLRKLQPKKGQESAVALAIAAVEGRPNPLDDPEMAKVNPHPGSLDLPDGDGPAVGRLHSHAHGSRRSTGVCPECGSRLKERRTGA